MLAYLSRTDIAIKQLEKLSWDWIKMDCSGGKCYGLLAVSRAADLGTGKEWRRSWVRREGRGEKDGEEDGGGTRGAPDKRGLYGQCRRSGREVKEGVGVA